MSGYRQSSFDPSAYQRPGPPLRPYNWVQWIGVGFIVGGLLYCMAFFLDQAGYLHLGVQYAQPSPVFPVIGITLINSRRAPSTEWVGSEQLERNRRVLLITTAICAAILGVASIFASKGY